MSGTWGSKIKISIFGESHGKAVGIVVDGLKPGIEIDLEYIGEQMKRRAPGRTKLSTARKEQDEFQILSGYFEGKTTGTPLCAMISNNDIRSQDYKKTSNVLRPGHADFTGNVKYCGFNDYRGGGHFSGRLTAPLVFAGALCRKILEGKGIMIGSRIKSIGKIKDKTSFEPISTNKYILQELSKDTFPVLDKGCGEKMKGSILKAREEGDSLGGVVETAVVNLPAGIGEPFFDSVESTLSHLLFSVPAVKGVEFGQGFNIAAMKGSEANDQYYISEGGSIKTYTNNNGGILGGITNGMPLIFRAAVKPTPSIAKPQKTVDIENKKNTILEISGRHDPCIVPRAVPVIEAVTALGILDLMQE
ncbi:chorismate synthase [Clostridium luticellarii]|jgi:chorismate synthase|uniref:Chorismate synthase n=1 Tax=Clostridium luticellarii TaxID=1691940 RepID=A0A2T0BGB0_9CLOT|nr:chorismate synthase [Clostridium luticellarii]MCI1944858.1 chorismate synthase [Clostridium luticellarii]MCI1968326.1 chorismate synthase [Clostridium luticellarii]MCI1995324.1 chorismate synthase [Clostridium luticellarii]MCI2039414.1 chorismate synthase [Clostridium luticellarii]PRR82873.1 Chorismate synthase [Clostridium luticellarii]